MLFVALIFGALGASFALVLELVVLSLSGSISYSSLLPEFTGLGTMLIIVLIEESSRYLLLRQYMKRFFASNPCSWQQACLTGVLFGAGFASIELALLWNQGVVPMAFLGIALIHIAVSILFSLSLTKKLPFAPSVAFVLGLFIHLAYNVAISFAP